MRPVSARFLSTVRGSHRMVARARLCAPGQTGTNPVGTEIPILDGDVKSDPTAKIRASLDLTTVWPWPTLSTDLLTPYGNEVFVERGVVYGDGVREWVSQGYFRIYRIAQASAPDGAVRITGRDRMSGVVDADVLAPFQFDASTSVSAIFSNLIGEVYPGATINYDFTASSTSFTSSHVVERDRYAFLDEVARSLGKVIYWAYDGSLMVVDAPDPTTPVSALTHGRNGVLARVSRELSRDGVYNAVVANGEAPGESPPVRAVAYDLDGASPTYWHGGYGKVPRFFSSSFLTTDAQCATAATAMLARAKGLPYQVNFDAVPNPALESLDAVSISYSDRGRVEVHAIDTLTIPLTPDGVMSGTTRLQTIGSL